MVINVSLEGRPSSIHIGNGRITKIGRPVRRPDIDASAYRAIPGMIDVHTHGMMGVDAMDCDLQALATIYAQHGTTTFLATTMTASKDKLKAVDEALSSYKPCGGANIAGIHFEGPFISQLKCGAQNPDDVVLPDPVFFSSLKNARMVTVAPEVDGAVGFIREFSDKCVCSIGHTVCSCAQALEAMDAGANCLTHMFNAMPPMLHREPGPIGAAVERQAYVQLICDGNHVDSQVVKAAFAMFPGKVVLISDSISPAGLKDGVFNCGGVLVHLEDGKALIDDGHLAGSTSCLLDCVRKAVEFGIEEKTAIEAATKVPAKLMGFTTKGEIREGFDADILIVDDSLCLRNVIIGGHLA